MSRLLQINATCNWGSTGCIVEQIASLAEKKGWDCFIAHGARYVRESSIKTIPIGSKIDNHFHAIQSMFLGKHGLSSTLATKAFLKKIESIQPDVIHLHNIHGYYINYRLLFEFLKTYNHPVVWTFHDCWPMTGQCTHFETIDCHRWKTGCYKCPLLDASYKSFVDRSQKNWNLKRSLFTSLNNLTIVPVSHWLDGVVKESFFNNSRTYVIHNGIDLNVFKPLRISRSDLGIDHGKIIVLGVSSEWGRKKGLNDLVKLSENPEYQVVLIGVTKQQKLKLPQRIMAIEHTYNQEELVKYYSAADVFVNPTYEDSLPTVNLEALACGTPVVTYRTGGSSETIDESTGAIVKKGDLDGLVKAIESIRIAGKESYLVSCRNRAINLFNKNDRYEDYVSLYEGLIK